MSILMQNNAKYKYLYFRELIFELNIVLGFETFKEERP